MSTKIPQIYNQISFAFRCNASCEKMDFGPFSYQKKLTTDGATHRQGELMVLFLASPYPRSLIAYSSKDNRQVLQEVAQSFKLDSKF